MAQCLEVLESFGDQAHQISVIPLSGGVGCRVEGGDLMGEDRKCVLPIVPWVCGINDEMC